MTGDNGILNKSSKAKEETIIAGEKEKIKLAYTAALAKKLTSQDNTPITNSEINEELKKEDDVTVKGNNPIEVEFGETKKKYEIYESGKIVEVPTEDMSKIYTYDKTTGYITGVKEEYTRTVEEARNNNIKIASLEKIEVAIV